MSKSRLEWKVGLFVLVGLVLLGALALQFSKGTTFFRPTYTIKLRTANVGGLKLRSAVLMAGVQIGTVSDIRLAPGGTNAERSATSATTDQNISCVTRPRAAAKGLGWLSRPCFRGPKAYL